jgi:MFS family permease
MKVHQPPPGADSFYDQGTMKTRLTDELKITKRAAYLAVLSMGIVSMLGDIAYESGRGIAPDYLRFLGASAFMVGAVSGAGEFIGYAMRLISGPLADRSRAYWLFIFLGYGLILAVPLMGFTSSIEIVMLLLLLERFGKALRSPSRDAVVSIVSKGMGSGKAFGLHEFIDQIGAVIGPAALGAMMFYTANSYPAAFRSLLIPYVLMMAFLAYTYTRIGRRVDVEARGAGSVDGSLTTGFWLYCAAIFLNTLGLIPVALILYKGSSILQPSGQQWIVPLLYVVVQLVDAPMALASGILFDRLGVKVLAAPFALSVLPAFLVTYGGLIGVVSACIVYGLVLGMQESIYRAAIADLVPMSKRGTAYGIFNTALGVGTLAGGAVFGYFIDQGFAGVIMLGFAVVMQAGALVALRGDKQLFVSKASP